MSDNSSRFSARAVPFPPAGTHRVIDHTANASVLNLRPSCVVAAATSGHTIGLYAYTSESTRVARWQTLLRLQQQQRVVSLFYTK